MRVWVVVLVLLSTYVWGGSDERGVAQQSERIVIRGNTQIPSSQYLNALGVKQKPWYQYWNRGNNRIPNKIIPKIADTLKDYLDSRGFYDARISIKHKKDLVVVNISENRPVLISSVVVDSDFDIAAIKKLVKGDRFEAATFVAVKKKTKRELMKEGYCRYNLDAKAYVDLLKHTASIRYKLKKGKLCRFGKTKILTKPKDISEGVIRSRIRYREGDVFNIEKINETYEAFNALEAFGDASVAPQESDQEDQELQLGSVVPMEIALAPRRTFNVFKGGVGYDSVSGMRLLVDYERLNLMGSARKFTSKIELSKQTQSAGATFFSPALLAFGGRYLDFYADADIAHKIFDKYSVNAASWKTKLIFGQDDIQTAIGIGAEAIDIRDITDPTIAGGKFLLMYPFVKFVYDGRDSKINPKNGYYFSSYSEFGMNYKAGASRYYKFLMEGRAIRTFGDMTLAAVGKFGAIDELSGKLPVYKLFYAGGAYSNRAYGDHEIGYITSPIASSPTGGKTWLNLSVEASYPIYEALYGAVFWDSTMLSKKTYDFQTPRFDTVGAGLRYETPIGPIKVDVGLNIHDRHQYGISFQMGQSF